MIGSLLHSLFLASLILWQEVIVADISGLISSSAPSPSAFPAAKPALNAFSSADLATPTLLPSPLPTIINEEDCDFEYRYDSRIEKNSGENIKIERRCQINNKNKPLQNGHDGRDNNSSLNNNLEIKVNTGGNNSNFGHILPRSGDVKIDISIKNNVE